MPRGYSAQRSGSTITSDEPAPLDLSDSPDSALAHLSLAEIEETGGELHRRIGAALRLIGEERADTAAPGARSPRWLVCELAASIELAAQTLAAAAAGVTGPTARLDRHAAMVGAVMYAAPTLPALLTRLEQDRRMLASLARTLEDRIEEPTDTAWGHRRLRAVLVEAAIAAPARCALPLERIVSLDA